jgi:hypothetical protein
MSGMHEARTANHGQSIAVYGVDASDACQGLGSGGYDWSVDTVSPDEASNVERWRGGVV